MIFWGFFVNLFEEIISNLYKRVSITYEKEEGTKYMDYSHRKQRQEQLFKFSVKKKKKKLPL